MAIIKVGDKFTSKQGCEAVVTAYGGAYNVRVKFLDEHGCERTFSAGDLRSGLFKNPCHPSVYGKGFLGVGLHKSRIDGKQNPAYTKWAGIIRRVYSENRQKSPSYMDCKICKDWLNFQNFALWYENNKVWGGDCDIDKDLLVRGNKVYSPETCALVPQSINKIIITTSGTGGNSPTGVCRRYGKYEAKVHTHGKQISLGLFNTPEEAHAAYVTAKEAYVKEVAEKWKGKIDPRVYDALMRWRVNPE